MLKSGLIVGAVSLLFVLGITLVLPYCTPCGAIFLGLAAGYAAGIFDKPLSQAASAKAGAAAGAIALGLGLVGAFIGAIINSTVFPVGGNELLKQLGLPPATPTTVWIAQLGAAFCLGLLNIALGAGLGALGGILWWSTTGKNTNPPNIYPPSSFVPPA